MMMGDKVLVKHNGPSLSLPFSLSPPLLRACAYISTVVNNESADIIRILNSSFNDFAVNPGLNLEPAHLRAQMAEWDDQIYNAVNNGVYK